MKRTSMTFALLGLALVSAPAFATAPARPGTLNYVEGAAYLDGQKLNPKDVGSIDLEPGQELTTGTGKAEVLLTPGVYLRVGSDSAVKMVSPDLTMTQMELDKGHAGVEVDQIYNENNLQIADDGVNTRLEKDGYYEFNADQPEVQVFKGRAAVEVADGKTRELKDHHELMLAESPDGKPLAQEKPKSFNTDVAQTDNLYDWSRLRSEYLADANNQMAGEYAYAGYTPGWYWDPYGWDYTYFGAGPFYSPFGWGFYPLGWGWGGWYGGGWYGGRYFRGPYRGAGPAGFHGGGEFHGGGGFHGGGFAGGGGFHGGGGFRR